MKCDDVLRALNDDTGDVKAVRRHLEICPECAKRFARDLEIEETLRNICLDMAPIDITAEVRNSLRLVNKRQSVYTRARKWIWVTVSVATVALFIISMPILAGWLSTAYRFATYVDIGRSIDSAISSTQRIHLVYAMVAILVWVVSYLWREARKTVAY